MRITYRCHHIPDLKTHRDNLIYQNLYPCLQKAGYRLSAFYSKGFLLYLHLTGAKNSTAKKNANGAVEVDFWFSGGKTAVNVLQDTVDAFNKSQKKYHINTVTQADYDETYEKLQAGIAGKKAPDMALLDVDKARNLSNKNTSR